MQVISAGNWPHQLWVLQQIYVPLREQLGAERVVWPWQGRPVGSPRSIEGWVAMHSNQQFQCILSGCVASSALFTLLHAKEGKDQHAKNCIICN